MEGEPIDIANNLVFEFIRYECIIDLYYVNVHLGFECGYPETHAAYPVAL